MTEDKKKFYLQLQHDAEAFTKGGMEILVAMQGKEKVAVQKDEIDLSTSADLAAEKYIIDAIKQKYPDHSIYSEEAGNLPNTSSYRWIIDPLDETKEYFRGIAEFNCLIAIEENGHLIGGASLCHGTNELYAASKGNGAYLNGKPIHVSTQTDLFDGFIGFALPNRKIPQPEIDRGLSLLGKLVQSTYRVRGFWDHAKSLGWVARGALDGAVLSAHLYKWPDVASSISLVEEAGGKTTDFFGNEVREDTYEHGIIASNGKIHEKLLEMVKQ